MVSASRKPEGHFEEPPPRALWSSVSSSRRAWSQALPGGRGAQSKLALYSRPARTGSRRIPSLPKTAGVAEHRLVLRAPHVLAVEDRGFGVLPQQGPAALSFCPQNNPARCNPLWRTIVSNATPGQLLNIALAEAAPWEAHAANAVSCPFDTGRLHSRFDAYRRPLIYSVGSCSTYAQNDGSGEQQAHGGPPGRSSSLTPHRLILMLQKWLRFIQRAAKSRTSPGRCFDQRCTRSRPCGATIRGRRAPVRAAIHRPARHLLGEHRLAWADEPGRLALTEKRTDQHP